MKISAPGNLLSGLIGGLVATAAMTVAMEAMYRWLPREEQYPLPPREITTGIAEKLGVPDQGEDQRVAATLLAHFGFGAIAGTLYPFLSRKAPFSPVMNGVSYGLGIWAISYLGWIPAFRILPPATQISARRNALMIVAHVVWGATLGIVSDLLGAPSGESQGQIRQRIT